MRRIHTKQLLYTFLMILLVLPSGSQAQVIQRTSRVSPGKTATIQFADDTVARITRTFLVRNARYIPLFPYQTPYILDFYRVAGLYNDTFLAQYGQIQTDIYESGCITEVRHREKSNWALCLLQDGTLLGTWSTAHFIHATTQEDDNARKSIIAYLDDNDPNRLCMIYPSPNQYKYPAVISLQGNETWQQLKAVWQTDSTYDLSGNFRFLYHSNSDRVDILLQQQLIATVEMGHTLHLVSGKH